MENTRKYRYIRGIASLLFGCAICLFWGLYYPHHLHYHEQFQLFLFTPEYGIDKCLHPGGIAEYIAEFLTQFYYFAWAGATILAIVIVLIQRQINWLAKQMGASDFWYPLSFLPSILLWVFLCDENALLAFPVSITLALFALVMVLGLAAIITYYKGGVRADGAEIVPNDAQEIMDLLKQLWATGDTAKVTEGVLGATFIWGEDLNLIPGLAEAVKKNLDSIQEKGMLETVKAIL